MRDLVKFIEELLLDAISPTARDLELIRKCSASILLLEAVLSVLDLPHFISFYGALGAFALFNVLIFIKKNEAIQLDKLYARAVSTADRIKDKLRELDDDIGS